MFSLAKALKKQANVISSRSQRINEGINNFITDCYSVYRCPCTLKDRQVEVSVCGGNSLLYDSDTDKLEFIRAEFGIYNLTPTDLVGVDRKLLQEVYNKLVNINTSKSESDVLKAKYNIVKEGNLTKKQLREITLYELRKKGDWQASPLE